MTDELSYEPVGATLPGEPNWAGESPGFRRHELTLRLGHGTALWRRASGEVLNWRVKTGSGFTVGPAAGDTTRVQAGEDYVLVAHIGPFRIHEPVRVVAVVDEPDRCGFAYGTRPGHPVSGEEAFIVHRTDDGVVWLTMRSLTRPARGRWRLAYPGILVAQRWYRRRYRRALLRP